MEMDSAVVRFTQGTELISFHEENMSIVKKIALWPKEKFIM